MSGGTSETPVEPTRSPSQRSLDEIAKVMRDKTLSDDMALSEIQDWLTIAGYDVPLRSYRTPPHAQEQVPQRMEPSEAAIEAARKASGEARGLPDNLLGRRVVLAILRTAYAVDGVGAQPEPTAPACEHRRKQVSPSSGPDSDATAHCRDCGVRLCLATGCNHLAFERCPNCY